MALRNWVLANALYMGVTGSALAQDLGKIEAGQSILVSVPGASSDIYVEVDAIDVSAYASLENGVLTIDPLTSFGPGKHQILVYDAVSFDLIAEATFTGSQSISLNWSFDAVHEAEARSVNGDQTETFQSSGALSVETDDQSFTANVGYYATSADNFQIDGNPIDISEYLFTVDESIGGTNLRGNLGHHTISYDNALISDLTKRGLSGEFTSANGVFQIGLFGMRVAEEQGVDNFSGLAQSNDRLQGAQIKLTPFKFSSFSISAQGYEGEGAAFGSFDIGEGDGYSFSISGASRDGRVRYGATAARATWDEDGSGGLFQSETANAAVAFLSYDFPEKGLTSATIGLEAERVDQDFFSLANEALITGVETYRVTADILRNNLSLGIVAETEETNFNGDADEPIDRINTFELSASINGLGQGVLSDASLTISASVTDQKRLETPALALDPADYQVRDLGINLDKYGDIWGWGIGLRYIDDDDQSADDFDLLQQELSGYISYSPSADFDISANAWIVRSEDIFEDWVDSELDVALNYAIVPEKWDISSRFGVYNTNAPGGEDGQYFEASLSWTFLPSAALVFSGRYAADYYASESGTDEDEIFSILLRANTNFLK